MPRKFLVALLIVVVIWIVVLVSIIVSNGIKDRPSPGEYKWDRREHCLHRGGTVVEDSDGYFKECHLSQ